MNATMARGAAVDEERAEIAARNMRIFRVKARMPQAVVAAALGCSKSLVCRLETPQPREQRRLREHDLTVLAELFGVPVEVLVTGCAYCRQSPPAGWMCPECGARGERR